jgi:hypothetical protein
MGLSTGGAIVSGGSSLAEGGQGLANNNVGAQIANSLFNSQSGQYHMPTPNAPPAPPEVQAANMLIQKAAMPENTPPLPPTMQALLDGGGGAATSQ